MMISQASQLDATMSRELELDAALYAQQQLDGALTLFQTTLNDTVHQSVTVCMVQLVISQYSI